MAKKVICPRLMTVLSSIATLLLNSVIMRINSTSLFFANFCYNCDFKNAFYVLKKKGNGTWSKK